MRRMATIILVILQGAAMLWCRLTSGHNYRRQDGGLVCWDCGRRTSGFVDDGLDVLRIHGPLVRAEPRQQAPPAELPEHEIHDTAEDVMARRARRAEDPLLAFEQQTALELAVGYHQRPIEWRGNPKIH